MSDSTPAASPEPARSLKHDRPRPPGDLEWTADVSLLSNRLLWSGLLVSFGGGTLYALTLLLSLALFRRHWDRIVGIMGFIAIIFAFVMGLSLIAMAILGFRMSTRTLLTSKGVIQQQLSRRARGLNRLATVFGPLAGVRGITAAGTGMLAEANQTVAVPWSEIWEARMLPGRNEIQIRNQWRTLLQLHCPTELYESIAARIGDELERRAARRAERRPATPTPLRLILTLLLIAPSVLLLAPLPIEIPRLLVLLIIALGLACAWSAGTARRAAGLLLLLASVGSPLAAWWRGDLLLAPEGAIPALVLQLGLLLAFAVIGAAAAWRRTPVKRQDQPS